VLGPHDEDIGVADAPERPADHVGRNEQGNFFDRDRGVLDEVARAVQADFFQVEPDEHHAPLRLFGPLDERSGDLQHHRDARGVVVGPGIQDALLDAQVVEVGRHDDPLVAQGRVGADQAGADVAAKDLAGLKAGDRLRVFLFEERFELQGAKRLDQVRGGLAPPFAAPAFERGGGEGRDLLAEAPLLGFGGPGAGHVGREHEEENGPTIPRNPWHHQVPGVPRRPRWGGLRATAFRQSPRVRQIASIRLEKNRAAPTLARNA
jgi:hypothetical protein